MARLKVEDFAPIFYPKSVAVIGASPDLEKFGGRVVMALKVFGYKGKLYPVNPQEKEIFGLKAYPSINDIPGPVELAAIGIPARGVPAALRQCLARGVKAAEIFSSGFAETGQEEGRRLETELGEIARDGMRIVGPNCFGVYCPAGGLTILPGADFPKESGPVAFMAQSGGFAGRIGQVARGWGIRFSKMVSYGNACDINEVDLLEYFAQDPETRIILSYIEGVKDGPRFVDAVRRTSQIKPVVVWKAGLTKAGSRAVSSHTASLGGEERVWEAFFKQSGAIRANNMADLLDTAVAFLNLPPSPGTRMGLVGGGGGLGAEASDVCERAGLSVPLLTPQSLDKLRAIIPGAGTSIQNPVDVGSPIPSAKLLRSALEVVAADPNVDTIVLNQFNLFGWRPVPTPYSKEDEQRGQELREVPVDFKKTFAKPVIVVEPLFPKDIEMLHIEKENRLTRDRCLQAGIPVFPDLERAIKAYANIIDFYRKAGSPHAA
jgi:acyl-CoA synthetase (NDP forming)